MRILVAMSGGVDSSVSAALLKEQGHEIVGVFMRNGAVAGEKAASGKQGCCSIEDGQDARFVARSLDARFYVLNFKDDFSRVIDYFVEEYRRGRTPNPCAVCNTDLKFGKLLNYAQAIGADRIATGHYARVEQREGRWRLLKGADEAKDQSYYLFGLTQEQLAAALFPVGHLRKPEVRELADRFKLRTASKPESMEICFVPEGDYRRVVEKHSPDALQPGPILDLDGNRLGEHRGVANFTIGQRKGIGIASERAYYVIRLEPETNTVVVGDEADLELTNMHVQRVNWISVAGLAPGEELRAVVRVRYRHAGAPATLRGTPDGCEVIFDQPERAITPGQAAVFYGDGERLPADECLGGGWIA